MFRSQILASLRALAALTVLLGLLYPLSIAAVATAAFPDQAEGSLVRVGGEVVGSRLIGQGFTGDEWFQPRPSAAGDGYDALASSASNLGPTNPDLLAAVAERVEAYRSDNGLDASTPVPVDAVTSSGSGLDPHISVANAMLQVRRVAKANGLSEALVQDLVRSSTVGRSLGFIGEEGVDVLALNIAVAEAAQQRD